MDVSELHNPDFLKILLRTILERSGTKESIKIAKGFYELVHPIIELNKTENMLGEGLINLVKTNGASAYDTFVQNRPETDFLGGEYNYNKKDFRSDFDDRNLNEIFYSKIEIDPGEEEEFINQAKKDPSIIFKKIDQPKVPKEIDQEKLILDLFSSFK